MSVNDTWREWCKKFYAMYDICVEEAGDRFDKLTPKTKAQLVKEITIHMRIGIEQGKKAFDRDWETTVA